MVHAASLIIYGVLYMNRRRAGPAPCKLITCKLLSRGVELGQLPDGVVLAAGAGAEVDGVVEHPQQVVEQHDLAPHGHRLLATIPDPAAAGVVNERGDQRVAEVPGADDVPPARAAHEHHRRRPLCSRRLAVLAGGVVPGRHGAEVAVGAGGGRPPAPRPRQALAPAQHHAPQPVHARTHAR
uniref:Uncharacterized protein n=1 Tax=Triticum urartu TaxID=4572 RepID=A0A8R7QCI9_TRIUA